MSNNYISMEEYLRKKDQEEREQKIQYLLEIVRQNPDVTEEFIRPDLRKYLGIAKREYKKEICTDEYKKK